MKTHAVLFLAATWALASTALAIPRASADYAIVAGTNDSGGRRSASADYAVDASFGAAGASATQPASGYSVKAGYPAQLFDDGGRLFNLSVRSLAGTGADTLIVGFVVSSGGGERTLLLRGIGPTLAAFGVSGTLPDPVLTLFSGNTQIAANDNWGIPAGTATLISNAANQVGAFPLPPASADAVLLQPVANGPFTAQLTDRAGGSGIALVEVYDTTANPSGRLINVSSRTRAGSGSQALVAGFVITGTDAKRLLIRGIGPTLTTFGVAGALANPQLALHSQAIPGVIVQNEDWSDTDGPAIAAAAVRAGAFALPAGSRDACLLVTLEPGAYTVQVSGAGTTSGIALIEVYALP